MSETMADYEDQINASFRSFREGDTVTGEVVSVEEEEVLLDLRSFSQGVIPSGEYSDDPNFHAMDEIRTGEMLTAVVLSPDDGQGRVLLSLREAKREEAWEQVEKALEGGATLVQLREKELPEADVQREAEELLELCHRYGVKLILDDDVELAAKVGADGVHIGQSDMELAHAREILGPDKIIGVTAKTVEQAKAAEAGGADYLGSGAVFGSTTKKDAIPMKHELLEEICHSVKIPVVAIGGITAENVLQLKGRGIAGVAVVSGIFACEDIETGTRHLGELVEQII